MPRKRTKKFNKKGIEPSDLDINVQKTDKEECSENEGATVSVTKESQHLGLATERKESRGNETEEHQSIAVVQNIRSKNTQIGSKNVIHDHGYVSSEVHKEHELQGAASLNVVDKTGLTQNIIARNVNIQLPQSQASEKETDCLHSGIQDFLKYVNNFDKGLYILVADRTTGINELDVFALVDWIAVIDFDINSRISGLLSYVEEPLSKRRSLHIVSWQEEKCIFSDTSLYWIGIKGCSGQPDTITSDDFQTWKRKIKQGFMQQLKQLKKFGDDYTNFTVIALWPRESSNYKHIQFVLNEISDALCPKEIVIIDDGSKKSKESDYVLNILTDDFSAVNIELTDVCKSIAAVCKPLAKVGSSSFQLPTADNSKDPKIDDQKAQWLKEDLEVLYLTNETGIKYDLSGLEEEETTFYKGGTLPWSWWYQVGPGRVDIQRDIAHDLIGYIKTRHISLCRSGCITLFHYPGSGGTTLSQRVIWTLMSDIPCVQMKHRGSSAITDIAEKIEFLFDKTHMPIFVLIDGGDEQKVDSLQGILGGHCCVIILYVKRNHMQIDGYKSHKQGVFWLKSTVSTSEAENLKHLYSKLCTTERQRRNLEDLLSSSKSPSLFDFGFAMYSYKYRGIESYVQGYLKWDMKDGQKKHARQKALAYLSLVYYYGQASLPIQFFAHLLGTENAYNVTTLADIPGDVKELMMRDVQDRRKNVVRIAHYYIAKEILDQVLVYPMSIQRALEPTLSRESKKRLGGFAVEFIEKAGKLNKEESSSAISYIMTRTFVLRDNKAVGENETQVTKKRQRFSQILEDASSCPPFTERFNIYQALTDSFPLEAQFRAHLGRLFTHCRPDETELAEKCFQQALEISKSEILPENLSKDFPSDDIPFNNKLDLMHIYHMYGNMILKQIAQYTGKYLGDRATIRTASNFDEIAKMLLPKVKQACELFSKCRDITPIGCEGSFGYIGEIQVRLMFCDYVHRNSGCRAGICKFIETNEGELVQFVNECIPIVDDLFLSCFSNIEPEKMDRTVSNCMQWYSALFNLDRKYTVRQHAKDAMSRRLEIAKVKMKYCQPDSYGILEHVNDVSDVQFIVEELEKNFKDYENKSSENLPTKRAMDLDYREWLVAIRHPLYKKEYAVDRVLQQVQLWHDLLHTPHSLFYLFVMKSLHGMGNCESQGDSTVLFDAQITKEEMLKRSKYVTKPRYPREWLGKPENNIRQLVSGLRFFGQVEGRDIKLGIDFDTLEVQKGTICAPNDKPAGGFIDLDLGPYNRVPLKVFFVPVRSEGNLKGSSYKHSRVEFLLGFSLSHGYEAFNVRLIDHQICHKCKKNVEKRSCDTEVECPRCSVRIQVDGVKKQAKQSRNGANKL
ncbi:uncharacterized protein LOC128559822 [Mercenaria mercenaria]|uniref:uncharacterized protein LOC128559822 n=1 Tax=Mercenaria mercenaria TaxID=6596 RepID=UPI00234F4C46|nr:uncharacterized protein LOC128559822 [Mercenaria mercenaria]XP_053408445.1 uncharacterized protein LOC128559822 [Mercenaria mercenaria]